MKRSSTIPSRPTPTVSKARPSRGGNPPRRPRRGTGLDRGGERGAVERLARTFHALGDPTRSRMVLVLLRGERCVSDLAQIVGLSLSAASHQLRILRDLDIVRVRRAGKHQFYALNELAFGFCSPRSCHAWRHVLEPGEPSRP